MSSEPEHIRIADEIPALLWHGVGPGRHPTIVSIHGAGGSKEDVDPGASETVTNQGVTLVTIDAYDHGERRHSPASGHSRKRTTFSIATLEHTAAEIGPILSYLGKRSDIDGARTALRGGSMGGYIVLAAASLGAPARAVLSICGAADYSHIFAGPLYRESTGEAIPADEKERMRAHLEPLNPLHHVDRFPPRPVLMIHGANDTLVPIAGHRALHDALVPHYHGHPQDCLFVTHAGGHETPRALEMFGWQWLVDRVRET